MKDLAFLALGYAGMIYSKHHSPGAPSVWNPLIDLGSFAVAGSLILTQPENSWARRVGMLQFGVHLAQLVQTNPTAQKTVTAQTGVIQ